MDAGVPIKEPVGDIAMGLIKEGDKFSVLSDILGDEDHLGIWILKWLEQKMVLHLFKWILKSLALHLKLWKSFGRSQSENIF